MPVMPVFLGFLGKPISLTIDHTMILNLGFRFFDRYDPFNGSRCRRCPHVICAPSNAGPVGLDAARRRLFAQNYFCICTNIHQ
ncbi:MAG: hypothetical protein CM1200mP30_20670 [Pseudomonadota bacterium]|nr:MAG: hypothetical protein CM1200mP30_20670 [Pseudomonadota bacterium]